MRLVVFTSNALRHKYAASVLSSYVEDMAAVVECKLEGAAHSSKSDTGSIMKNHFALRQKQEMLDFAGNEFFSAKKLFPIVRGEVNSPAVIDVVRRFKPDIGIVFGSSIIREPLLSLIPSGRFINLHLGLSPYYRGAGTNFWPFVNKELGYIGSTLLHLDAGIDTGDIIAHTLPNIESGDTVHSIGNKVIKESIRTLGDIVKRIRDGKSLNRVPQWDISNGKYYKKEDFTPAALEAYQDNLSGGIIEQHLKDPKLPPRIINFSVEN